MRKCTAKTSMSKPAKRAAVVDETPGKGWKKFKGSMDTDLGAIPSYAKKVSKLQTVTPGSIRAEAFTPGGVQPNVTVTEMGKKGQEHSVTDERMGTSVYHPRHPCSVCQLPKCVGHFGYIPLPRTCMATFNNALK